jgi:hypothetical protein
MVDTNLLGGTASVAAFELVINELSRPPEPGNVLIVRRDTGARHERMKESLSYVTRSSPCSSHAGLRRCPPRGDDSFVFYMGAVVAPGRRPRSG